MVEMVEVFEILEVGFPFMAETIHEILPIPKNSKGKEKTFQEFIKIQNNSFDYLRTHNKHHLDQKQNNIEFLPNYIHYCIPL